MGKRKKNRKLPTRSKLLNQGPPYKKRKLDTNEAQKLTVNDPFAFTEDDNEQSYHRRRRSRKSRSTFNKPSSGSKIENEVKKACLVAFLVLLLYEPPNSHICHSKDSWVRRSTRKRAAPPSIFEDFVSEVVPVTRFHTLNHAVGQAKMSN